MEQGRFPADPAQARKPAASYLDGYSAFGLGNARGSKALRPHDHARAGWLAGWDAGEAEANAETRLQDRRGGG